MHGLLLAAALAAAAAQADTTYLYRTLLLRAAPGRLLDVIELQRRHATVYDAAADARPLMLRHRQGDQWDLMVIVPMGSFADYYAPNRVARRRQVARQAAEFERALALGVAWREDVFVLGPPPEVVGPAMAAGTLYHVEMFVALPDQRTALFQERLMENAFLADLGRPQNLIFTRVAGARWDLFTVGVYRDLLHFAEGDAIPSEREDAAARAAGFEAASRIGTYLRTLIAEHHDTLAGAVR